jgi:hypothetical protein
VRLTTNCAVTREKGVIMSTQMSNLWSFRWRSLLGLAVVLFLLYGAINVLAAVFVPLSLHMNGAGGAGGALVLDSEADAMLVGRTLADLDRADPRLGAFLVSLMDTMCAYMMAFAIVHLGVTWFALRQGRAWALWVLLVGDLAIFPYYMVIGQTYARLGVSAVGGLLPLVVFALIILAATVVGWFGLRQIPRGADLA